MDAIPQLAVRIVGGLMRVAIEIIFEQFLGRLLEAICDRFQRHARWIAPSVFLITPITIFMMLASAGLLFVIVVKMVQWALL